MKLSNEERSLIDLVARSRKNGAEWVEVVPCYWNWLEEFPHKELIELKPNPNGGGLVRLTYEGVIVHKWL